MAMSIRPMTFDDLPFMLQVRNESREMLKDSRGFTIDQCREWFIATKPEQYIISTDDDGDVGVLRVSRFARSPNSIDIGGDIASQHRRKGYAYRAYCAMLATIFAVDEDGYLKDVYLEVLSKNMPAFNLYRKLGFEIHEYVPKMAKRGDAYLDGFVMHLSREKWNAKT
jgi:RimJ/RimL family protein N-acetyltransferase